MQCPRLLLKQALYDINACFKNESDLSLIHVAQELFEKSGLSLEHASDCANMLADILEESDMLSFHFEKECESRKRKRR
jgi:hypothetical protein